MSSRMAGIWAAFRRKWCSKDALPCVGLVILGGCLSLVITPEESQGPKTEEPDPSGLPTVVIDPGHGGKDEGTKWHGVAEKDLTLDVGLRVDRLLKSAGFPTSMTRRDNTFIPLPERVRIANRFNDALFVSIHFNSDGDSSSSGIQTHYAKQKNVQDPSWNWMGMFSKTEPAGLDNGEVLAGAVEAAIVTRTDARNRGIYANNYFVVRHTRCPAILVEGGFISNSFECQMLSNEQYREQLAKGIAEGVINYVKMRPRPATPAVQPQLAQAGKGF